jgi:beta-ribofuranosylaminobenzene 5'-phosphate synthase
MIEIITPGRLHFGLLSPSPTGSGGRRFGGVGMMVERPGVQLRLSPAAEWTAEGPLAERALAFARHFAALSALSGQPIPPQRLVVESAPPPHAGLGSGTQLGMAVARGLALATGRPDLPAAELARLVGRGLRSGVGVHGFARGGFLVDAGLRAEETLAPLVAWAAVPCDWRVVLALPPVGSDWHGPREQQAFEQLATEPPDESITERLCRLVLLGLLPALVEADLESFGEALFEFNVLAGAVFAPVQGGTYASPRVAEMVAFLRQEGVRGAGQSSWGPSVFAVVGDEDRATNLAARLRRRFDLPDARVLSTPPCNHGAKQRVVP